MVSFSRFIDGQRESKLLLDSDGYLYSRKKERDSTTATAWRCQKYRTKKCPCHVYLTVADQTLTQGVHPHTHDPGKMVAEKSEMRESLKRKAADQHLSATQNLLTEALSTCPPELNVELPKLESLARVVQRSRAKASGSANHSEAPSSAEFVLPPTCQTTLREENFVLFDGVTDTGSRLIVFTTEKNLRVLAEHPNWIVDGTFYVCPKIFQQSYSIHAVIDRKCVPLVFALLSDKTEKTYIFLLNTIKNSVCNIIDGIILIDFEKAAMNAFSKVFEQFNLMNCFFHLCQSVQKRIFRKFKVQYRTDKSFARASRLVAFLAFVPLQSIDDAFEALSVHISSSYPALMDVVHYFEKNYLGLAVIDGSRTIPKYPIEFWNHHSTIMVDPDYPRTSNLVEGFHRGFRSRVNRAKPSVQEYLLWGLRLLRGGRLVTT